MSISCIKPCKYPCYYCVHAIIIYCMAICTVCIGFSKATCIDCTYRHTDFVALFKFLKNNMHGCNESNSYDKDFAWFIKQIMKWPLVKRNTMHKDLLLQAICIILFLSKFNKLDMVWLLCKNTYNCLWMLHLKHLLTKYKIACMIYVICSTEQCTQFPSQCYTLLSMQWRKSNCNTGCLLHHLIMYVSRKA